MQTNLNSRSLSCRAAIPTAQWGSPPHPRQSSCSPSPRHANHPCSKNKGTPYENSGGTLCIPQPCQANQYLAAGRHLRPSAFRNRPGRCSAWRVLYPLRTITNESELLTYNWVYVNKRNKITITPQETTGFLFRAYGEENPLGCFLF